MMLMDAKDKDDGRDDCVVWCSPLLDLGVLVDALSVCFSIHNADRQMVRMRVGV